MRELYCALEEGAFKVLSTTPHLKKIMRAMWVFIIVFRALMYLLGYMARGSGVFKNSGLFGYVAGIICFGYVFYRWEKYEQKRAKKPSQ